MFCLGGYLQEISSALRKAARHFYGVSISGIFERAFAILGLPVQFTEGFNPLPRMELTQPLALGLQSGEDVLAVWLQSAIEVSDEQALIAAFNRCVPRGIRVEAFRVGRRRAEGKHTIGSHYWGSSYSVAFGSRSDFERARTSLSCANANESIKVDENKLSLELTLNDAHGGNRNILRLLGAALGDEKPLSRCMITRVACLAADDRGMNVRLRSVL